MARSTGALTAPPHRMAEDCRQQCVRCLGRCKMTDALEAVKGGRGEEGSGTFGHLDGHFGVLRPPQQVDRAGDRRHVLGVGLGQQPHEHAAHDALGCPVVGGPVPVAERIHPSGRDQPHPVEATPDPEPDGRPRPAPHAVEQGNPGEHDPLDAVGDEAPEPDRHPATEGVTDQDDAVGQHAGLIEEGDQLLCVLGRAPGFGRCRRRSEAEEVGSHRSGHSLRVLPVERTAEVEMRSPPSVEGEHRCRSGAPGFAEHPATGERLQHRPTVSVRPSPAV